MKAQLQSLASGRLGSMLVSGQRVKISGLKSRPELTDSAAKVLCFDSKRGRYAVEVQLDDRSESMFLKRSNLEWNEGPEARMACNGPLPSLQMIALDAVLIRIRCQLLAA